MERWAGKVALVTGASVGIGAALVEALVKNGINVVGCARNIEKMQQLANQTESDKGEFSPFQCDLAVEEQILDMFKFIKDKYGTLHICINNAGLGYDAKLLDGETQKWKEMLDVNVLALSIVTREAVSLMRSNGVDDGHIFHINSMSGHRVTPLHMYSATKFAVTALTEGLRREICEEKLHIRTTSISPGLVETEFAFRTRPDNPNKAKTLYSSIKCLQGADIANAVIYSLSCPAHMDVNDIFIRPVEQTV